MNAKRNLLAVAGLVLIFSGFTAHSWMFNDLVLGDWTYVIKGTPQGDGGGTLSFVEEDGALSGEMYSDILFQTSKMTDIRVEGDSLFFTATFEAEGAPITTETAAKVEGDSMTGTVVTAVYGNFPFEASRKAETDAN